MKDLHTPEKEHENVTQPGWITEFDWSIPVKITQRGEEKPE